ncbi:YhcN/YlaJ family sporulation lipoprotein [Paenibacillus sp. JMULE4]|uniref:YhcN/YlaJ family sporulation lipoprotein n=1 Tax=Paenibacillus oralis TaxID=2490856 RepID=A0A3P3TDU7_9BACL|nr:MULTISPECIES: YhcN/YlaJ family sporulation lipoprotein [Paenibacillaceae]MCM3561583.1 YhcN/YlaJ family sporulation lipoprotein [Brevibacillus borstelensis]MCM3592150.1 YhcN/YlaJ family sporulation lipoprotein [Brevibacillus borstelensis]MEC0373681.1 YhcN/YlaJ family sporulation lipoprotein [Paenibacillus chibensis]MED1851208.1 YhcN/YlaJ family sporulation lipoprotein [Brevibacillus borstelensis]NTZ16078.1 YhcN/YlaJ family sporulation lipoprotein [Paenibacillus sp. JMULE4]
MTMAKKRNIKRIAVWLVVVSMMSTGCASKTENQSRQQGVQMQQILTPPQTHIDNRIQIADAAAEKIVRINRVKQANVLVTGRNAYVAVIVDTPQNQLSRDLEAQIAQQVRSTDPNIQNVYISANPEFVDRITSYVTDVRQGRPVSGFYEQFTEIVQRLFPKAR